MLKLHDICFALLMVISPCLPQASSTLFNVIYCAYLYLYVYSFTRQLVYLYLVTNYL